MKCRSLFSGKCFLDIFLFFQENRLCISCKMSPEETICINWHSLFFGKNKKKYQEKYFKMSSAEILTSMLGVSICLYRV